MRCEKICHCQSDNLILFIGTCSFTYIYKIVCDDQSLVHKSFVTFWCVLVRTCILRTFVSTERERGGGSWKEHRKEEQSPLLF
jgi:hypothetical protein